MTSNDLPNTSSLTVGIFCMIDLIFHEVVMSGIINIKSVDIYPLLKDGKVILVDVRTPDEWNTIGRPVVDGKDVYFITLSDNLVNDLNNAVQDHGTHVAFICKSGGRSARAASVAHSFGYKNCYNVSDGFESGWKRSLPFA